MSFNKFFWMEISLAGNGTDRKIPAHPLKPIPRLFWDGLHGVKRNMAASFLVPWKKSAMFWILILQLRQMDPGVKVLIFGLPTNPIRKQKTLSVTCVSGQELINWKETTGAAEKP